MAQTSTQSKWTKSGAGNVYTKWDSNVVVLDDKGQQVLINKHLKQEDGYEEKIGPNWYNVRNRDGSWLIFTQNEQAHQERVQKQSAGGGYGGKKGNPEEWYQVVDIKTVDSAEGAAMAIQQDHWKIFGRTFSEATQTVNGKLIFGLVKREKIQPGGSPNTGPAVEQPPT